MSEYFGYAQIFQDVRIYLIGSEHFDMRRYFEDVRIHFRLEANVLCVNYHFRQAPIFSDFCSKFCPVLFFAMFLQ